jgi:heme exporter protein A
MTSAAFAALAIEAENLSCERGGRLVFSGVSFRLGAGQLMAVTGPNGSGKSSLLRLLAGFIRPETGVFRISRPGEDAVTHYLGHADALKAALTLRETLRFWGAVYVQQGRLPTDSDFDDSAEAVGLRHALDLPVGIFSAGQRRRAALARLILACRPLWLLDEPTSSLDSDGEGLLGSLMKDHLAAGGLIVAATHADLPVQPDRMLTLGAIA